MRAAVVTTLIVLAALPTRAVAQAKVTPESLATARLEAAERSIKELDGRVLIIERLYARESAESAIAASERRFNEAEIQFLLGEHGNAAVLLYDLVEDRKLPAAKLADSYYYLAESLYQQRNFLGARRYFKEILERREGRYVRPALTRYLEISAKVGDYGGMERYFQLADQAAAGGDRPELAYVYAKWSFRRSDVAKQERLAKAEELFKPQVDGPYGAQARYFLGVIAVERGELDEASARFTDVIARAGGPRGDPALGELATMSLGRVLYEQGKFDDAVERYARIPRESPNFNDALYEIAWTYVKKGSLPEALRATDLLLLVSEETTLSPDAKILHGTLLLKLQKYDEAKSSFEGVINTYAPVRDEIDALLTTHADPVAYFNELLAQQGKSLDVTQILPPVAVKWATTESEVGNAVRVVRDIDESRTGIAESRTIATRLLENLGKGTGLEASPALAEGMAKADAADAEALSAEQQLVAAEALLVADRMPAGARAELEQVRKERQSIDARFATLPKSPEAVDARKVRMMERLEETDQTVYRLGYQVDSLAAQIRALQKWLADTRETRTVDEGGERAFLEELQASLAETEKIRDQYAALRKTMSDELARVGSGGGGQGEADLRARYGSLLQRERELTAQARAGTSSPLLTRLDRARTQLDEARGRVSASKQKIRVLADARAAEIRAAVVAEAGLLDRYDGETTTVTASAQDLVGRIAFESFRRVRKTFYTVVLKADVGLIDVAWTRKRDKSDQIQKLAQEKDRDLKSLDDEFKDVLTEEP